MLLIKFRNGPHFPPRELTHWSTTQHGSMSVSHLLEHQLLPGCIEIFEPDDMKYLNQIAHCEMGEIDTRVGYKDVMRFLVVVTRDQ